ncbi:nucleotidyltransferase family protein [Janibacter massiliensis]|uniref:nucleotidyltransferase family protein n=1 Tax=Janibacter massiliensis TaxID=2058291 RepID=UPI000D0F3FEC|nr:nucleotidyltransferase family protein [Janibacter massiliensis]
MPTDGVDIPLSVRVAVAHAVAQHLADEVGADVLHVKGPVLHPSLAVHRGGSTDADVLVRPEHVAWLIDVMRRHGWAVVTDFRTGSVFEHAATLRHRVYGYVDVHRHFPGFGVPPSVAFDRLWGDRGTTTVADREVPVPSIAAQALLLVLHAGRGAEWEGQQDVRTAWHDADPEARAAVAALRDELDAGMAFAVAVGDDPGDAPDLALWQSFAPGATRTEQWRARIAAAPDRRSALRIILSAALVNTDHLAMELGRRPTPRDVLQAQAGRVRRATSELRQVAAARVRRRRG